MINIRISPALVFAAGLSLGVKKGKALPVIFSRQGCYKSLDADD
jgi:hypothetical protein